MKKLHATEIDEKFLQVIQDNPGISAMPYIVQLHSKLQITKAQRLHSIKRLKRKGLIYEKNGRYYPIKEVIK